MTTIRDVAERAQVSVGTVSRVMNNHPTVNPAIRRVVLEAIEELQYHPNSIARTLRTSRTRTLGLVISDLRGSQVTTLGIWGAEAVAQDCGYALLVADSQFNRAIEARNISSLLERRVDGLVCNPVESSRVIHDLVAGSGVPTVVFGWTAANRVLPTVVMSETDATTQAINHLVDAGHRRIAVILRAGPRGTGGPIRQRIVHDALRARGVVADGESDRTAASPEACTRIVRELLSGPRRPTALIVTASPFMPAVLTGIKDAGVRVPQDVSLICFGDLDWAEVVVPPLNVIALDFGAHVESATRLVVELAEQQQNMPRMIEHRARYIRRGSVQPPPGQRRRMGSVAECGSDSDAAK